MGKLAAAVVTVTDFQQNCTLLFDDESKAAIVIDPGGEIGKIAQAIEELELKPEAIWLTHGHIDHAAGAMDLKEKLKVQIVGPHKADEALLGGLQMQAQMFGIPYPVRNCTPDRWLEDGDTLMLGEHRFDVYHTPGHAPGHVIFFNEAFRFVQLGDTLFHGSIGRTDLPGGDHATLLNSIAGKIMPLGDDVAFICGHGPGGSIGEERRTNPFLIG